MPKLGDFIGALLSDAATARVQADLASLKIAEVYAGHDLLKHLPVPRFRLPEVSIEFPVVVSALATGSKAAGDSMFTQPSEAEVKRTLGLALSGSNLRVSRAEEETLRSGMNDSLKRAFAEKGPRIMLSSGLVSAQVAMAASAAFAQLRPDASEETSKLEQSVQAAVQGLLMTKLTDSPHVEVRVESGEIKAHDNTDSVLRIRLTITEDAYEMVESADPRAGYKLVPE